MTGENVMERRKGAIRMRKKEIYWEVRKRGRTKDKEEKGVKLVDESTRI